MAVIPSPTPLDEALVDKDFWKYMEEWNSGHIEGAYFDECVKLQGSSNYPEWLDRVKICACLAGFGSLCKGNWKEPERPDDGVTNINEYHRYMRNWKGYNERCVHFIKHTLEPPFQWMIEKCTLVSEALDILDHACPPASMGTWLAQYRHFHRYSFDETSQTFSEFSREFTARYWALKHVRGATEHKDIDQCTQFLVALGPQFRDWITNICMIYTIGGSTNENGKPLSFIDLQHMARNHWEWMNREEVSRQPSMSNTKRNARQSRTNDETEMWKAYKQDPDRQEAKRKQQQQRNRARNQKKQDRRRNAHS